MEALRGLQLYLEQIILDPRHHDLLVLVKAIRNGIVYGTKVRFPHALVTVFLFRSGTFRQKLGFILKATKQHARNLGLFAFVYKSTVLVLRSISGKEGQFDSLVAGLLGGYVVFGRTKNAINQQIVIYIFARVVLGLAKLAMTPRASSPVAAVGDIYGHAAKLNGSKGGWGLIQDENLSKMARKSAWPIFATCSWAIVMYLFRWHPKALQPSLRSSMHYIYESCDDWDSLRTFLWHSK